MFLSHMSHTSPFFKHGKKNRKDSFLSDISRRCTLWQDRSKLSKRHGATSVDQFRQEGFLPVAMLNYLCNLGWNDGTDKEIYTPQELIDAFELERVTTHTPQPLC